MSGNETQCLENLSFPDVFQTHHLRGLHDALSTNNVGASRTIAQQLVLEGWGWSGGLMLNHTGGSHCHQFTLLAERAKLHGRT